MNNAEVRSVGGFFREALALCQRGYFTILLAGLMVFIAAIVLALAVAMPLMLLLGQHSVIAKILATVWSVAVFGLLYASFTFLVVKLSRGESIKARQVLTELRNVPNVVLTCLCSYMIIIIAMLLATLIIFATTWLMLTIATANSFVIWTAFALSYIIMLVVVVPITMGMIFAPVKVLDQNVSVGAALMHCLRQIKQHYGKLLLVGLGVVLISMLVNVPGIFFPSVIISVLQFLLAIFLILPYVACVYAEIYRDLFA